MLRWLICSLMHRKARRRDYALLQAPSGRSLMAIRHICTRCGHHWDTVA